MPRPGEHTFFEQMGEDGRLHSLNKPFSDPERGIRLMEAGAVLALLPSPPARVLECGSGTGWFAWFMAKSGFEVVAQDVSAHAVELARSHPLFTDCRTPQFVAGDFERLDYADEFDAVVFFDSLHHAIDEQKAIACAWRALRPGGRMIASEPGRGHAEASREYAARYDVTDKDMPPAHILRLGKRAGFRSGRVYPHAAALGLWAYSRHGLAALAGTAWHMLFRARNGIAVLIK